MNITEEEFTLESLEVDEPEEIEGTIFTESEQENIQIFHFLNGEQILAVFVEATELYFIVKRPMILSKIQNENGNTNLMLSKWTMFSDAQEQLVTKSTVMTYTSLAKDMKDFYIRSIANELKKEENLALGVSSDDFLWPEWMDTVIAEKNKLHIH